MKYYYGYFRDTDCKTDKLGNLYKVIIKTNYTDKKTFEVGGELMLSSSPFTVSWNGQDDNLFKGYKCSTATVGMYQDNYNFEFNNTKGNNVYVALGKLKKNKKIEDDLGESTDDEVYDIVWTGYATPNAYSQEYNSSLDYFELECQDALSTLKYYEYKSTYPNYKSFSDIIIDCIDKVNSNYNTIYITSSLVLPTKELGSVPEFIYIDERNFFDEDNKGQNRLDLLGEICKFLGVTIIPWGDSLYVLDYYNLENGEYYTFTYRALYPYENSPKGWRIRGTETKNNSLEIDKSDIISSSTNLSLGSTYNKATVVDDHYEVDRIIQDSNDSDIFDYRLGNDTVGYKRTNYCEVTRSDDKVTQIYTNYNKDTKFYSYYKFKDLNLELAKKGSFFNKFDTHWYNLDENAPDENGEEGTGQRQQNGEKTTIDNLSYKTICEKVGACYVDYCVEEVNEDGNKSGARDMKSGILLSLHNNSLRADHKDNRDKIRDEAGEYINGWRNIWNDKGNTIIRREDSVRQRLFNVETSTIALSSENYINIKGNFKFFGEKAWYVPKFFSDASYNSGETKPESANIGLVWGELSDGSGKYWDGEKWKDKGEFKTPFGETLNPKFPIYLKCKNGDDASGTFSIANTDNWNVDFGVEGLVIPVNVEEGKLKTTTLTFSLFRPWGNRMWYLTNLGILEDFDICIVSKNGNKVKDDNTNSSFTNELPEEDAVEEYSETTMKITGWEDKNLSHSSTFWYDMSKRYSNSLNPIGGDINRFGKMDKLFNKATGEFGRPEELVLRNICRQYSTPTVTLEISLFNSLGVKPYSTLGYHFLGDRIFVVDGMSIDYSYDTVKLRLVERK